MAHLADLAMSSWLKYPARTHKESAPVPSVLSHQDHSSRKLEVTCDGVTTQGLPLFCPEHASPASSKPLMSWSLSPRPPSLEGSVPFWSHVPSTLAEHTQRPTRHLWASCPGMKDEVIPRDNCWFSPPQHLPSISQP